MFGICLVTSCLGSSKGRGAHDCNILTYERGMLARFSGRSPRLGYLARVTMRVTTPNGSGASVAFGDALLRALEESVELDDYLDFRRFSVPAAGEVSVTREVIENVHASDWGFQMSILSEMHRNQATSQICQVDIADTYNQMHQEMSSEERLVSLNRMARISCRRFFGRWQPMPGIW